ncbi:DUF732 domain-containing protein [Candidatus Mycobacterium methanotrophicum]|uniref:DUF732 domain-containing protein n=1 Tax=Candidatus Mycobacterium methanotrophicum TaxID=2943498 RepID=A0ABY4QG17_9MYCO|nr:DUF732 domain-containing protein [Candidatus Mycobacterium methanotrophicum]UQX09950.1 DUF732 domain-containing protein [Candidatus Mycobacterium methanotrophicum]
MTDDTRTQLGPHAEEPPTQFADYPLATEGGPPEAYSAEQEIPAPRRRLWRDPRTRVTVSLTAALTAATVAAYLAGAAHPRIEQAAPIVKTVIKTVTKTVPGPPDDDGYIKALNDEDITGDPTGLLTQAHDLCANLYDGKTKDHEIGEIDHGNPGLHPGDSVMILLKAEQFFCPSMEKIP